ncbi:peroxiredoxin [Hoeflea sp. TYP-13]|uniref:peroxiredoxin n=1 Tax=Hoeflea sp. TYP-13 TaxID=3230023 RepID=UPI0034C5D7A1
MLKKGDQVPNAALQNLTEDGPVNITLQALSAGRTLAIFAVPGAFTPTCSQNHLPGFLAHESALKSAGIDEVVCICVTDFFVMDAWGRDQGVGARITLLADGNGDFTKAADMELDLSAIGLGTRSKRYAMTVRDGMVQNILIEKDVTLAEMSGAPALLSAIAA